MSDFKNFRTNFREFTWYFKYFRNNWDFRDVSMDFRDFIGYLFTGFQE